MKKLLIVIIIMVILSNLVLAKLNKETSKEVEKLRLKHYGYEKGDLIRIDSADLMSIDSSGFEYEWQNIYFEDGKLIVSTNKGKWFIEMEKVEE